MKSFTEMDYIFENPFSARNRYTRRPPLFNFVVVAALREGERETIEGGRSVGRSGAKIGRKDRQRTERERERGREERKEGLQRRFLPYLFADVSSGGRIERRARNLRCRNKKRRKKETRDRYDGERLERERAGRRKR